MNKGYAIGFISSDIKGEDMNLKSGGTMRKISFSIALQRRSKEGGADFPWFSAIGKNAENIERYFQKGRGIIVEYHLTTGSYTNKEGKKVYTEDKLIDSFEFPPVRKNESNGAVDNSPASERAGNTSEPPASDDSFMDIPEGIENELPFK